MQPVRPRGDDGIWVVNRWRHDLTAVRAGGPEGDPGGGRGTAPRVSPGSGRRGGCRGLRQDFARPYGTNEQVPLLYATTTGARYERFEIEQVGVPQWPSGGLAFEVRLFAEDGATVVEQQIAAGGEGGGALALIRQMQTTENGRPVPQPFVFMDGKLTVLAPHPWDFGFLSDHGHTALDYDENHEERIEFVDDPLTVGTGCDSGQSAANAAALADAIRSDPDLVATAPVTVTIAGHQGLAIDISAAPGASICADARRAAGLDEGRGRSGFPWALTL